MSGPVETISWRIVFKSLTAVALVLVSYLSIDHFFELPLQRNALFGLGFLVLGGIAMGRLCQMVGLPSLTGYLAAGILSGSSVLSIVEDQQVEQLRLVNSLALALIALHAGSEFTMSMLKNNFKSLFYATWTHIFIIGFGVTGAMVLLRDFFPEFQGLELGTVIVLSAVFATIAISKSPAAVVAILGETKIKNKLSEHALGIVVVLDVLVLVLFSIVITLATSVLNPDKEFSISILTPLVGEIIASIAAGTFFGLFIIFYLWLIKRETMLFIVVISYGVTAMCSYLHYDTLLVFVVAGFVVTNFSKQSEKLISTIESLSSVIMILFFATAGASLHLKEIVAIWPIVVMLFLVRVFMTWLSENRAHHWAKSPDSLKKYGFTPFISQAGLSIGLAIIVYDKIPLIGPQIASLAIAVVTLNEIFGPIIFKWGLTQVEKLKES